jgi:hypothetical protein
MSCFSSTENHGKSIKHHHHHHRHHHLHVHQSIINHHHHHQSSIINHHGVLSLGHKAHENHQNPPVTRNHS